MNESNLAAVLEELHERYCAIEPGASRLAITNEEIVTWAALVGSEPRSFLNRLAATLAVRFFQNHDEFAFCDVVMKSLVAWFWVEGRPEMPDLFWQIFLAFDSGGEPFTRPLIEKLFREAMDLVAGRGVQ